MAVPEIRTPGGRNRSVSRPIHAQIRRSAAGMGHLSVTLRGRCRLPLYDPYPFCTLAEREGMSRAARSFG